MIFVNTLGFNSDEAVYAGQAAAIARVPILTDIFPIFRAHPMLFQIILSFLFRLVVSDVLARLTAALIGILTVYLVFHLGSLTYGPRTGLLAALFLAIMPYHVVVSRQVLLDGPMVFFITLTFLCLVRFSTTGLSSWLYAAGASLGLAFLCKETAIVLVGSVFVFLALSPRVRLRIRDLVLSSLCLMAVMVPFPLTTMLAGGGSSHKTQQYLVWQLFRPPNHEWDFYLANVPKAIGLFLILVALLGLVRMAFSWTWRETMLLSWIVVPLIFYQLWPTKGFQYLLPLAPPFALLAARSINFFLSESSDRLSQPFEGMKPSLLRRKILPFFAALLAMGVSLSLLVPTWTRITPSISISTLAGSGGVPGGREAGLWIRENIPQGATLMTIGPSMANILQFYGYRKTLGLSVSSNPLHRNPSYQPIVNPDYQLRSGEIQYLVWDIFSASRSAFFSEKLLAYAEKYRGKVIFKQELNLTSKDGQVSATPSIIIFEVHP